MNSLGYNEESIAMMELSLCDGIGPVLGKHLLHHFGSAAAIFQATKKDWDQIAGLSQKQAFQLHLSKENHLKAAKNLAEIHVKMGISVTTINSNEYPYRLKELANGPLLIYCLGNNDLNAKRILGVVGTRKPSPHGIGLTKKLIEELSIYDISIVSGLAYGVDIVAHQAALDLGIPNWAVLAHGLEQVYPVTHKQQALQMIESMGGLISDFPAHTKMHPDYFPKRNRIVAGLCDALLVIESGVKGGSMITASIAHGYSRDVFAVPGRPSDKPSEGCNFLIKSNMAQLVTCGKDIAEAMNWTPTMETGATANSNNTQMSMFSKLNPVEQQVMHWLLNGVHNPDDMLQQNQWSASHISMALLDLELKGLITNLPGNQYMSMI
jgi:DNA processing protein